MKTNNVVADKSFLFAIRVVRLYQHLIRNKHEYVLSKQLLKSGTSCSKAAPVSEPTFAKLCVDSPGRTSLPK